MNTEQLYEVFKQHHEVTTDSRRCPGGSIFFALHGDAFDGNLFAGKALEAGCAVAVVDNPEVVPEGDGRYILVPDALKALQDLAACHRRHFRHPVIQVTGTNGKTTTKELMAAVLSRRYNVLYTQGNLNNHIGVPLTLLRLNDSHDIAVIETGANHPGEIAFLTRIVDPDYGLVTNVGCAHIEGFGSFEGVMATKGELYDYLAAKKGARIFINESNFHLQNMLVERDIDIDTGKCICYAREQALTQIWKVEGDVVACDPFVKMWWRQDGNGGTEVETRLIGAYNIDNLLAAACVGTQFGISQEEISAALTGYQPGLGRSEYRQTERNRLIVDAYNANPTSMQAALDNFRHLQAARKMAILGDMNELGADSEKEHLHILTEVVGSDIREVWLVGCKFARAFASIPVPNDIQVRLFPDVDAVREYISVNAPRDAFILIKGSNSTRLHQLPALL